MVKFILFIWQLPQNLIGLIVLLFHFICGHKPQKITRYGITVWMCKHIDDCGVSLGNFILLDSDVYHDNNTYRHEYGHHIQSLYLGWLYLFIIGIPSAIHNLISRKSRCNYYHFYTEKWANKLGGVK